MKNNGSALWSTMTAVSCKQSRSGRRGLKARGASPLAAPPRRSLLHGNCLATLTIRMDEKKKIEHIHTRVKRAYTWSERQSITTLRVPRATIKTNLRRKHSHTTKCNLLPMQTFLLVTAGLYTLLTEQTRFLQAPVFENRRFGRLFHRVCITNK